MRAAIKRAIVALACRGVQPVRLANFIIRRGGLASD